MPRAVCIVDSDASVREGLSRVVESAGYEVRRFDSVEAFVGGTQALGAGCAVVDLTDADSGTPAVRARLTVVATLVPMIVLSTTWALVLSSASRWTRSRCSIRSAGCRGAPRRADRRIPGRRATMA